MMDEEFEPAVLTDEERDRFGRDRFLVVDRPVVPLGETADARAILADLFARFDRLPADLAYDLGEVKHHDGAQQIPEINCTTEIEPRLAATAAVRRCRDLARQILGHRAVLVFDHAICKPAGVSAAVEWHQDLAYANPDADFSRQVHIWLALQDVTEDNGCLRYIPNQGRGLLPHHRRGNSRGAQALVADGVDQRAALSYPLRAGMVAVHRMTTLHSSGPNTTDTPRLAWVFHFRDPGPVWAKTRLRAGLSKVRHPFRRRHHGLREP